jgi:hypothetical protein
MKRSAIPALLAAAALSPCLAAEPTKAQLEFFEATIRPILADNCYKCHSIEKNKNKGGLTLDTRDGVLKGGDSGAVIKPGDPEGSLLIKAIHYTDPEMSMPPKNGGGKLADKNIAALTEWVKMGAPDPRLAPANGRIVKLSGLNDNAKLHWAYQPLADFVPPQVKAKEWVKNPVDAFVLAKLEAGGMTPNAAAPREALIRRVTFDLTGLPPTPQEVAAFLNDQSPNAWEKVVDRLLASPHYGERWGRHWLDTARYSDTTGGQRNNREEYRYAFAWTYRDYVIQAINADKPYNDFVIEQLAADRIPEIKEDDPRLAGLGFLTVGQRFPSRNDEINDRIDVVSKGFLGLTVTCARCHDHMFDPIPTEDYYALHGVFASSVEPRQKPLVGKPSDEMQYKDFLAKEALLQKENRDAYYRMVGEYLADFREKAYPYLLATLWTNPQQLGIEEVSQRGRFLREHDLDENIVRFLQQRLRNPRDPVFGPWAQMMDLAADEFAPRAKEIIEGLVVVPENERVPYVPGETIAVKGGDKNEPVKPGPMRAGMRKGKETPNPIVVKLFQSSPLPRTIDDVAKTYGKLFGAIEPHAQTYLKQAATATEREKAYANLQPEALQLIEFPVKLFAASELDDGALREAMQRMPSKKQGKKAQGMFAFNDINNLQLTHPGAPPRAMLMSDSATPRNSPVLIRGQQENKGDIVPRRFLEILTYGGKPQPFASGSGRWELAQAIATHPLTARVAVNRVWMHHFGDGIVPTPDDLGVQSEKPSHPELLEWLAGRFMHDGWSLKKLHKLVLMSATYQQSTTTRADYEQRDPANRLLWRANIRRLDFEGIRDSLLSFSGKLDPQIGGKPINLTDEPYSYRRSVYGYIDRGNLPELMSQFDFSDPDMPNSKRATSIVPQQALFLMNSPMAVDVARKVTQRPEFTAATDDAGRLRALYTILFQRAPSAQEAEMARQFLADNTSEDTAELNPADVKRAMARAQKKGPGRNDSQRPIQNVGQLVERKPLTAWELYTQALLFTNEVAYVN